jgi:hypothetical protein
MKAIPYRRVRRQSYMTFQESKESMILGRFSRRSVQSIIGATEKIKSLYFNLLSWTIKVGIWRVFIF